MGPRFIRSRFTGLTLVVVTLGAVTYWVSDVRPGPRPAPLPPEWQELVDDIFFTEEMVRDLIGRVPLEVAQTCCFPTPLPVHDVDGRVAVAAGGLMLLDMDELLGIGTKIDVYSGTDYKGMGKVVISVPGVTLAWTTFVRPGLPIVTGDSATTWL